MSTKFKPFDVVVVGGGISGLTCAFLAKQRGLTVRLFEASSEVGGCIRSVRSQDCIADSGPQSFTADDDFLDLIRAASLDSLIVRPEAAATTPYLFHHDRLLPLPRNPKAALSTSLLSLGAKVRLLAEPLVRKRTADTDESIASFVRRRAGNEVLQALVNPMVSGIFAGDTTKLSTRSAFPMLVEMERKYGSVLRGARLIRKNKQRPGRQIIAFRGGNAVLPLGLAQHLGTDLRTSTLVKSMWHRGEWFELLLDDEFATRAVARSVIVATPAPAAADFLEIFEPQAATQLRGITYAPVVQIALAYPREAVGVALDAFGFLAARDQGLRILGCVWNSVMFADRSPADKLLLTVFLGGATDTQVAERSDEELARIAHADLQRAMSIGNAAPQVIAGFRWQQAIPQYNIGHAERTRTIQEVLTRVPRLYLCGNYLRGPGVGDCVKLARSVVNVLCESFKWDVRSA